jgi:hypothetical protein
MHKALCKSVNHRHHQNQSHNSYTVFAQDKHRKRTEMDAVRQNKCSPVDCYLWTWRTFDTFHCSVWLDRNGPIQLTASVQQTRDTSDSLSFPPNCRSPSAYRSEIGAKLKLARVNNIIGVQYIAVHFHVITHYHSNWTLAWLLNGNRTTCSRATINTK